MDQTRRTFRITPNTITKTPENVEIKTVRMSGAAFQNCEENEGLNCIQCNRILTSDNVCSTPSSSPRCCPGNLKNPNLHTYEDHIFCKEFEKELRSKSPEYIFNYLNDIYKRRLSEIDEEADGDCKAKIATYKEWVETLKNLNIKLSSDTNELEQKIKIAAGMLANNCTTPDSKLNDKTIYFEEDIMKLVQMLQNAHNNGDWSHETVELKTMNLKNIFQNLFIVERRFKARECLPFQNTRI